ncbi:predicted protein, partial [Nematostella vectensis]
LSTKCGCTGIRSCLFCKDNTKTSQSTTSVDEAKTKYLFCHLCSQTLPLGGTCSHELGDCGRYGPSLDGITLIEDFVSQREEARIVQVIDETVWKPSQSGRRKQDYGPQVNFKKKKVKMSHFNGLPAFSEFLVRRMNDDVPGLKDFVPVELCNLEYDEARGSSIDAHFDDFWLWGERLVTLNLLSATRLTMTKDTYEISVPMPRRSLIIVSGAARHLWQHAVKREDISGRRIAITLRELSEEFCKGGRNENVGFQAIKTALTFNGTSV